MNEVSSLPSFYHEIDLLLMQDSNLNSEVGTEEKMKKEKKKKKVSLASVSTSKKRISSFIIFTLLTSTFK